VKIAVYAPAKNEANNVREWAESAQGADQVVLVDTGSTDDTLAIAEEMGLTTGRAVISPWRFDDGRNAALWHVSDDIDVCIALDLDERLEEGWRETIEAAYEKAREEQGSIPGQYTFLIQWAPTLEFRHDKIHARHGYRWIGPAHESLEGPGSKVHTDLRITHLHSERDTPDYSDLIHLAYRENKTPRTTYYSAREHYYQNDWDEARRKFQEYLAMPSAVYDQERAEACRLVARMVWPDLKEKWLLRACSEAPQRREPWAELALYYKEQGRGAEASGAAARALSILERTPENSFHCEDFAWNNELLGAMLVF
jgi:glycosyltransferase involved in cell wall biosynthesis